MRAVLEGLNKITASVYFFILNNIIKFSLIIIATILFNSVCNFLFYLFHLCFNNNISRSILGDLLNSDLLKKIKHSFIDLKRLSLAFIFIFYAVNYQL